MTRDASSIDFVYSATLRAQAANGLRFEASVREAKRLRYTVVRLDNGMLPARAQVSHFFAADKFEDALRKLEAFVAMQITGAEWLLVDRRTNKILA